ncbi:IS66 family insertion sequence element accessory protein TnpA [Thorsellia kenyensis]|uniref:Transposase n=1 Tax=Thorsellia kenyensis TaxID=1549888 RepID=A0ABV6CD74_9GAMM
MNLIFEDKINHLTAWRSSGLTQRQYCELHNLNYNTFKSWGQLLKKSLAHSTTSTTISEPKPVTKENPVT